ncbi:MAG: hypothetical protein LBU65_15065 [Planctomycetaceae bacterium]|jgi:hypothetical protein|nr:hypothetical protein [Planctomycetaceae bacterium]
MTLIQKFRRRIALLMYVQYATLFAAFWLFIWGIAALAFRCSSLLTSVQLCWGAVGLLVPLLAALLVVKRRMPSDAAIGALLDCKNSAGGLFTASLEIELGSWSDTLPSLTVPSVKLRKQRSWLGLVLGFIFLVTAMIVPVESLVAKTNQRMHVEDRVQKLTQQLDALAEEKILPLEEVEALRIELDAIEKNAEGTSPVKTLDALDHLEEQMEQKTAEAVENAEKNAEALAKAETLLESMEQTLSGEQTSEMKELMKGLAETMKQAMEENEALKEEITKQLEKQSSEPQTPEEKQAQEELKKMLEENKFGEMTPEQLKQLSEAMKKCDGNCDRMVERLKEGGCKLDPEALKRLAESRENGKAELDKLIQEMRAEAGCDGGGEGENENGEKQLSRTEKRDQWDRSAKETKSSKYLESETEEGEHDFRPIMLPQPELEALMNAQKIGTTVGTPEENQSANDTGSAIQTTNDANGSSHGVRIHPQHRGTTSRYFDRTK